MQPKTSNGYVVIQCLLVLWSGGLTPLFLLGFVALGENMADEYVHPGAAGMHCCALGRKVHHGIPGIPLHPHHDRATAPPHPVQDF